MLKFRNIKYSKKTVALLDEFFLNLDKKSLKSFRYFLKRPFNIIKNHLITVLVFDEEDQAIAYGHLDQEDGILWLGIVVNKEARGNGIGEKTVNYLIHQARLENKNLITLSVDKNNYNAINLYGKLGFKKIKEVNNHFFFQLKVSL